MKVTIDKVTELLGPHFTLAVDTNAAWSGDDLAGHVSGSTGGGH